jgi:hypothetical protein
MFFFFFEYSLWFSSTISLHGKYTSVYRTSSPNSKYNLLPCLPVRGGGDRYLWIQFLHYTAHSRSKLNNATAFTVSSNGHTLDIYLLSFLCRNLEMLLLGSWNSLCKNIYKQFVLVNYMTKYLKVPVRHVTGNDQDYLRKIPRVVVQKSALL